MPEKKEVKRIPLGKLITSVPGLDSMSKALVEAGYSKDKDIEIDHFIIIYEDGTATIGVEFDESAETKNK